MKNFRSPYVLLAGWIMLFFALRFAESAGYGCHEVFEDGLPLIGLALILPFIAYWKQWRVLPVVLAFVWMALPIFFVGAKKILPPSICMDLDEYVLDQLLLSFLVLPALCLWLIANVIVYFTSKKHGSASFVFMSGIIALIIILLGIYVWINPVKFH